MSRSTIYSQTVYEDNPFKGKPRIDLVLQATGLHGWNASHGWINVLRREGLLNRVFKPIAEWGADEPSDDNGLFKYLENPQADLMLLLGFDWHSQPLHRSSKWQKQWQKAQIKKVAIFQEHYSSQIVQKTPNWKASFQKAIHSSLHCVDAIACHHEPDVSFLKNREKVKKPIIFLPFAIDSQYFNSQNDFYKRYNTAFFRGNAAKHFGVDSYGQRKALLRALECYQFVKLRPSVLDIVSDPQQRVEAYSSELKQYRIQINLPSLSPTLTVRPYEIMGCGAVLLQNQVVGEISNQLFKNWQEIIFYDPNNSQDLITKIKYLINNPDLAQSIAFQGYKICHESHRLENRIKSIIEWAHSDFCPHFFQSYLVPKKQNNSKATCMQKTELGNINQEFAKKIKASAIVSTYNSEYFIRGCLQNLVEQTLFKKGELEIIVIDSYSQEKEQEIVKEFQSKYENIVYERTPQREPLYTAWNRAIRMAKGEYITNTNTDDRHRFDALELMSNYLDEHPDIGLVYTDQLITTIANDTFATTQAERRWGWPPYSYQQMMQGCCVGSQPMWRKSLHDKYGYFREEFKCAGDYEFWLRIGSKGEQMALIAEILGLYYFNPKGLEHGAPGRAGEECNLVCEEYNIPPLYIPKQSGSERQFSDLQYQGILLTDEEKDKLFLIQEKQAKISPKIVIDGVFFQLNNTGITRVWRSVLDEWRQSGFARHVVVLDRGKTAPRISGIRYRNVEPYDYAKTGLDAQMLQFVCDEIGADLFISTYYTAPSSTPSVFMGYDMVPEIIGANLEDPMWREKHYGILRASRYITISQSTANDLTKIFPHIAPSSVTVAHCGISSSLVPATEEEIIKFRVKYDLPQPYFLLVGLRFCLNGYKNAILFFNALNQFKQRDEISVICVGGEPILEPELAELAGSTSVKVLRLDDNELRIAYSGAIALIYPSIYEGFGLPIAEAMACGCPVITCCNSSLPEVAGDAAIYVDEYQVEELVNALSQVQLPEIRQSLITKGLEQVKQFSWAKMAEIIADVLLETAEELKADKETKTSLVWQEFRKMQAQYQNLSSQLQLQPFYTPETASTQEKSLKELGAQLAQQKNELQKAEAIVSAMQSSKFWTLRSAWFKIKPLFFPLIGLIVGISSFFIFKVTCMNDPL